MQSKKRTFTHVGLIVLMALVLGFFDLPFNAQQNVLPIPDRLENQKVHLGLDLQGGTQLDYQLDLRRVSEIDREQIIEGVQEVINRRVNGLGVSEPNIYRAKVAEEEHIVVELAGIQDIEEAKAIVGKTIQLEFKEENTQDLGEKRVEEIRDNAQAALDQILAGESFEIVGKREELANPGKVSLFTAQEDSYEFERTVSEDLIGALKKIEPGNVVPYFIEGTDGYTFDTDGNIYPLEGIFLVHLLDKKEGEFEETEEKQVDVSHLLVAYSGAERAGEDITRNKNEAKERAEEALSKAKSGENFEDLVAEYSDETVAAETQGNLGTVDKNSSLVTPFKDAALGLSAGEISSVVETSFGFHVIKVNEVLQEASTILVPEMQYKFERIYYSTAPDPWKETGLTGEHFVRADVEFNQTYTPYVSIQFNDEGGKLFEELTERNINKRIAIFVGGDMISAPNVNEKIGGGRAQITGNFTIDEASELARDLNTGAIPAPIVLVGQYTIGASLGQDALQSSIQAGLYGLLLLALYMLFYYRLPGLMANLALLVYATLLIFFIKVAMPIGLALVIGLVIFLAIITAILKSHDSGAEKMLSFLLACFVLFFMSYLLGTPIVLTLAGVAGVILSIGMAVDANILIFERMREELHHGRNLADAIEIGFDRAWSSIRDSNFSSLITCAILIYFGTSIIKGFAVNLALGILISMFTAITITRNFLRLWVGCKWGNSKFLMGIPKKGHPHFPIIQARKIWFSLSGILIIASLVALPLFGLKLGMDFTGGTLMEIQFDNAVTSDEIAGSLSKTKESLEAESTTTTTPALETKLLEEPLLNAFEEDRPVETDFGAPSIISSGENQYILRMKHISNETHDRILQNLENEFGALEETRFTTIGPTIGAKMKEKAIIALGMALLAIILYIAFAFRHVPKSISAWRFGLTAIAALVHDVIITLGVFVLIGQFFGVEIDALFITALLTIMGFSVHDTIVTFDRIRENLRTQKVGESFETVANRAVNETLARSMNTSFSTLITVAMLFFLGAASIHWFLFALIIGLIAGTYSSIFTATPLLVAWHARKNREE